MSKSQVENPGDIVVPFKVSELQSIIDELSNIEYRRVAGVINLIQQRSLLMQTRVASKALKAVNEDEVEPDKPDENPPEIDASTEIKNY